jgi:hypothetical protein
MNTNPSTTTVERAFQLARSGSFKNVEDIKKQLRREQFESIEAHLSAGLRRQLLALCRAAT